MAGKEQFEILITVLRRFQSAGILDQLLLIGSWCLEFYRHHFKETDQLPAFRTLDVDFLIPNVKKLTKGADIPDILKREGFVPTYNRANGIVKYDHPRLRVEFLVPELGRGYTQPLEIKKLQIKAQGLRYLNLLVDYPRLISYEGIQVCVPEPAVFAIHKLIISARRINQATQQTD